MSNVRKLRKKIYIVVLFMVVFPCRVSYLCSVGCVFIALDGLLYSPAEGINIKKQGMREKK